MTSCTMSCSSREAVNQIKLVVVGDTGMGKTSIINTYLQNYFDWENLPSVYDNRTTPVQHKGREISLNIWDTSGAEYYDRTRLLIYPSTDVILICFAMNARTAFQNRKRWADEVQSNCPGIPFIYVLTKMDMQNDPFFRSFDLINEKEVMNVFKEEGATNYVICSALEHKNLHEVFNTAVDAALSPPSPQPQPRSSNLISLVKKLFSSGR